MLRTLKRGAVSRDIQPVFTSRGQRGSGVGGDGVMKAVALRNQKYNDLPSLDRTEKKLIVLDLNWIEERYELKEK